MTQKSAAKNRFFGKDTEKLLIKPPEFLNLELLLPQALLAFQSICRYTWCYVSTKNWPL
jgi:hypothetical protein